MRQWSSALSALWSAACKEFTTTLATALDGDNDLVLVQAFLDLIELPSRILRPHCPGILPRDAPQALSWPATASVAAEGTPPSANPSRHRARAEDTRASAELPGWCTAISPTAHLRTALAGVPAYSTPCRRGQRTRGPFIPSSSSCPPGVAHRERQGADHFGFHPDLWRPSRPP